MARYTDAKCRLCRREGAKLNLKGAKCGSTKCPFEKRPVAPGQHGAGRKKISEYGSQLREKQKVKRIYGVLEGQFREYYNRADRMKGITGENMLVMLERRLDNVVYRMGIAASRTQARQLVTHGHFTVNGHNVNIASYLCNAGDVIAVKEGNENSDKIKALVDVLKSDEIKDFINEKYDGAVIPFEDSDDAEAEDTEAADAEADTADEAAEETDAE